MYSGFLPFKNGNIHLFREGLSYQNVNASAVMLKGIMDHSSMHKVA